MGEAEKEREDELRSKGEDWVGKCSKPASFEVFDVEGSSEGLRSVYSSLSEDLKEEKMLER